MSGIKTKGVTTDLVNVFSRLFGETLQAKGKRMDLGSWILNVSHLICAVIVGGHHSSCSVRICRTRAVMLSSKGSLMPLVKLQSDARTTKEYFI